MLSEGNDLQKIEEHCLRVSNSPYIRRQLPVELKNLTAVLDLARLLAKEDVPALIAEIKRLRSQNKRLEGENATLRSGQ